MSRVTVFVSCVFIIAWAAYFLVAVGAIPSPEILEGLVRPKTMAELGDSLGVVNGLMSSLAVILALQTLLTQRRDPARAEREQGRYHEFLMQQQRIQCLTARQTYLMGEEERLQGILDRTDGEYRHETMRQRVKNRKKRVLGELGDVEEELGRLVY